MPDVTLVVEQEESGSVGMRKMEVVIQAACPFGDCWPLAQVEPWV